MHRSKKGSYERYEHDDGSRNPRVPKRVSPDAQQCADQSEHKYAGTKRRYVFRC
jgi:hypothetical protein